MIVFDESFDEIKSRDILNDNSLRPGYTWDLEDYRLCQCCQKETKDWQNVGGYLVCENCEFQRCASLDGQLDGAKPWKWREIKEAHKPRIYYLERITNRSKLDIKPSLGNFRRMV